MERAAPPARGDDPWSRTLAEAQKQPALWAIVQRLTLDGIEGTRVVVRCPAQSAGTAGKIAAPKLVELLAKHGLPGATIVLKAVEGAEAGGGGGPEIAAPGQARASEPLMPASGGPNPAESPLVKRVQQVLGARVTRVVPRRE